MSVIGDIKRALDGPHNAISDRMATILTLSALLELSERVARIEKMAEDSSRRLETVEDNPSILLLLKTKPRQTILWMAAFFVIMAIIFIKESRGTLVEIARGLLF